MNIYLSSDKYIFYNDYSNELIYAIELKWIILICQGSNISKDLSTERIEFFNDVKRHHNVHPIYTKAIHQK